MQSKYLDYRYKKISEYVSSLRNSTLKFPASLQIGLTDYCYNMCITCQHWHRHQKHSINFASLIKTIDYGSFNGLETVCYSGGDPFKYEQINEVMMEHLKLEIDYGFITAGFVPRNLSLDLLFLAKFVRVSFDAYDNDVYKLCRGGSITATDVIRNIFMMKKYGVNVCLGVTAHNKNFHQFEKIFSFAIGSGVREIRIWPVRDVPELSMSHDESQIVLESISKWLPTFDKNNISNNLLEAYGIISESDESVEFNRCFACRLQLFINADGFIYPCCIIAGDTRRLPFNEPFDHIDNICDNWPDINTKIIKYSRLTRNKLPSICTTNCITRLSSINKYIGDNIRNKNFI